MAITLMDMLLEAGLITQKQSDDALRNRVVYGGRIGTSLIELGFVEEEVLARFLGRKLAVPYVSPEQLLQIPPDVICLLPEKLAIKYKAIPLSLESKRLNLVMADPSDLKAIDDIAFITGFFVRPYIAPEVRLVEALGKYYQLPIDDRYRLIIDRIAVRQAARKLAGATPTLPQAATATPATPAPPVEEELEEAEILEDDAWERMIESFSSDTVSQALAAAEDREEIAEVLVGYLAEEFDRGGLFLVRNGTASGWRGVRKKEPLADFRMVNIPLSRPSVLKTVAEGKSFYLGPVAANALNDRMLQGMGGGWPDRVLVMPLVVAGRVVGLLYAEGGKKQLGERVDEIRKLLIKAALAFEILICREKILMF